MSYNPEELLSEARKRLPDPIRLRRLIHRRPEAGLVLPQAQRVIIEALGIRLSLIILLIRFRSLRKSSLRSRSTSLVIAIYEMKVEKKCSHGD
jgi:hypothetical protein